MIYSNTLLKERVRINHPSATMHLLHLSSASPSANHNDYHEFHLIINIHKIKSFTKRALVYIFRFRNIYPVTPSTSFRPPLLIFHSFGQRFQFFRRHCAMHKCGLPFLLSWRANGEANISFRHSAKRPMTWASETIVACYGDLFQCASRPFQQYDFACASTWTRADAPLPPRNSELTGRLPGSQRRMMAVASLLSQKGFQQISLSTASRHTTGTDTL